MKWWNWTVLAYLNMCDCNVSIDRKHQAQPQGGMGSGQMRFRVIARIGFVGSVPNTRCACTEWNELLRQAYGLVITCLLKMCAL